MLGRALAKVEQAVGPNEGVGPGRGKRVSALTGSRGLLERIKVDHDTAMKAQRIGAIPDKRIAKASKWTHLPAQWATLYALATAMDVFELVVANRLEKAIKEADPAHRPRYR
jgi:hypothetical protein